jgi:ELP3 family radical SAM enzyme/protein acetyltransferase
LLNEPGVRRANQLGFDPVAQFVARVGALVAIGHPADKIELLVLGGTWESYPDHYRVRFIRDLFYAANTFFDPSEPRRDRLTLAEEQALNRTAMCKIIGVTLETRPDTINPEMLVRLRQMGCTRVQLGVQHTDDSILSLVNRDATRGDTARAIRLLKDACFKVDVHLMPDLPGASPDVDKRMFDDVLNSEELQADQWKIYPCQTTPFTVIHKWFEEGRYRSYGLDALIDVLLYAKRRVHPWIRLNRVIRDIPVEYVLEGVEVANLRQLLLQRLAKEGRGCQCMRCREVKGDKDCAAKLRSAELKERWYRGSGADEVFLSFETPDEQTLFGFLRLRLPPLAGIPETPFAELKHGVALIRELHVYGSLVVARAAAATSGRAIGGHGAAQHAGLGQRLLQRAEELALTRGYGRIAVISGVGVRDYYARRGYVLTDATRGAFMLKPLRVSRAGSLAAAAQAVAVAPAHRWSSGVAADLRTVARFLSGAPDAADPTEAAAAALTTPAAVKAAAAAVAEEQALMAQMPAQLRNDAARCLDIARRRQSRSRSRDAAAALGRPVPSRSAAQLAMQRLMARLACVVLVVALVAAYCLRA